MKDEVIPPYLRYYILQNQLTMDHLIWNEVILQSRQTLNKGFDEATDNGSRLGETEGAGHLACYLYTRKKFGKANHHLGYTQRPKSNFSGGL
jgi:hypothetical protein